METNMKLQEQSRLMSVPLEIFQDIHSYIIPTALHIFFRDGSLSFLTCVAPDTAKELIGYEGGSSRQTQDKT